MVYSCEGVGMQVQAASVPAAIRTLLFVVVVEAIRFVVDDHPG